MSDFKRPLVRVEKKDPLIESWKRRIVEEKGCSETVAERISLRLKSLAEHMQYGHAVIAYYKQDGTFQMVTGTLRPYPQEFRQPYDILRVQGTFVYWNVEIQGWRTFLIENFLEWKAIV